MYILIQVLIWEESSEGYLDSYSTVTFNTDWRFWVEQYTYVSVKMEVKCKTITCMTLSKQNDPQPKPCRKSISPLLYTKQYIHNIYHERNTRLTLPSDASTQDLNLPFYPQQLAESLDRADLQLVTELWFTEHAFGPDHHNAIQCVSARTLNLHFSPTRGLHYHLPVLFDYFHLSAVTLTVHCCLVALHQPYIK
ncbi:protein FAM135B-like [Penaeus chinensis]|uniref:protein FAM135B-like n=1 Tax=Penaeus chinensis TaxID=139456 RepID=UPI001FB7AA2C|nr:protein FAM135B-like [Penaeus chinensis]